jgi:L-fucose isomerase-like protein
LDPVQPSRQVVDDATLRAAVGEFREAGCQTLLVLQPTMGDGRLAPILAQHWDRPLVLWATPERQDSPRVSSCSLVGTHVFASTLRQMRRPFELVYGAGDEDRTQRRLALAARMTAAAARLQQSKIGLVGSHAPGFVNMHADPVAISRQLGVLLQHFGLAELTARIDACDELEVMRDVQAVRQMQLPREAQLDDQQLVPNSRYYLALTELLDGENLDALAVRCWPELPSHYGHWPYLAMMRLTEECRVVALEGDVDGALLGWMGKLLGIGVGYISDWLEHDEDAITLWHPGHAPRHLCAPDSVRLGNHFNNDLPLVLNGELAAGRPITLARLWRCDGRYQLAAFAARTAPPRRPLLGAHGTAILHDRSASELFETACYAGMPHHVTLFSGDHVDTLRRFARLIEIGFL